jgi:CheY-like chemotaxis protein
VDSQAGVGSTFHFRARFHVSDRPAEHRPIGAPAEFRNMNVLVVDDNATNRRILHDTLIHWQMRPHCVATGADAIQAMHEAAQRRMPFALILLDAMMPEIDGFAVAAALRANPAFDGTTIMMLSSAARAEDTARCRAVGIQAYLTKPVTSSKLFNAIVDAFDRSYSRLGSGGVRVPASSPTSETAAPASRGWRILLAEDNLINQKVMLAALQNVGHRVAVVGNGKEVLAMLEQQAFDLVLMDLQMPEMDGLQATHAIRAREKTSGRHLPIIALTAHAMKDDRARCLAGGMDDFLTKPVQIDQLRLIIEDLMVPSQNKAPPLPPPAAAVTLDCQTLLARVGGNAPALVEILDLVPGEVTKLLEELQDAVAKRDARLMQRAAHTLKGTFSSLSAANGREAAAQLESLAHNNELEHVDEAFRELQRQIAAILDAVEKVRQELLKS